MKEVFLSIVITIKEIIIRVFKELFSFYKKLKN